MAAPRLTLAQQLKQLQGDVQNEVDPETAYASLDSLTPRIREGDEGREHYLDVGPSRMKGTSAVSQTLLSDKYGGKTSSRMRIFDDDEEEEEEEGENGDLNGGSDDQDGEDDEGSEDEDEDGDERDEDEEEDDDGEDEEDDDEDAADREIDTAKSHSKTQLEKRSSSTNKLDPIASLRDSRMKDIEKGRAIKRQRTLFESLITLRITYQKTLQLSTKLPATFPIDPAGEVVVKKNDILTSLQDLSERLFSLREGITLPGVGGGLGKRKRGEESQGNGVEYWLDSARDSLDIVDASHPHFLPILTKWSTKIQAASLQVGTKQAGSSKFLQTTQSHQTSILEAISTNLQSKVSASSDDTDGPTFPELQETAYRNLLREVIESRTGSGPGSGSGGVDLGVLRKEKKKKREAERGGSKGRKLRFTVHEKAQNFVVPTALDGGWHEEQIDELFASLLGGGGGDVVEDGGGRSNGDGGLAGRHGHGESTLGGEYGGIASLGGLRVF